MDKEHLMNNTDTLLDEAMTKKRYIIYKLSKASVLNRYTNVLFVFLVFGVLEDAVYLFGTSFFKDITDHQKAITPLFYLQNEP